MKTAKEFQLTVLRRGRKWFWAIQDFLGETVVKMAEEGGTRDEQRRVGRREFKRYIAEIESCREMLRVKARKFPKNWKSLVRRHDKLGKLKVRLIKEKNAKSDSAD